MTLDVAQVSSSGLVWVLGNYDRSQHTALLQRGFRDVGALVLYGFGHQVDVLLFARCRCGEPNGPATQMSVYGGC
jgi:hypothetical protein